MFHLDCDSSPPADILPNLLDRSLNNFFGRETPSFWPRPNVFLFYRTSAAAPNDAAVGLMMLQADSSLTPLGIYEILEATTAIDMNEVGFDFDSGYGGLLVNAKLAIDRVSDEKVVKEDEKDSKKSKKDSPKSKERR